MVFPNLKWLILIYWVSPAVTILAIYFMVLVSAKANTFQEAQQMSAFIIIPVIFLMIGRMTGLFILNDWILGMIGAVLFVIDYISMQKSTAKFVPEKLVLYNRIRTKGGNHSSPGRALDWHSRGKEYHYFHRRKHKAILLKDVKKYGQFAELIYNRIKVIIFTC